MKKLTLKAFKALMPVGKTVRLTANARGPVPEAEQTRIVADYKREAGKTAMVLLALGGTSYATLDGLELSQTPTGVEISNQGTLLARYQFQP